jgi:hypothetical protein
LPSVLLIRNSADLIRKSAEEDAHPLSPSQRKRRSANSYFQLDDTRSLVRFVRIEKTYLEPLTQSFGKPLKIAVEF